MAKENSLFFDRRKIPRDYDGIRPRTPHSPAMASTLADDDRDDGREST